MNLLALSLVIASTLAAAAPSGAPAGPLKPPVPALPAAGFAATVDNPYFPLRPGTVRVYETRSGKTVERDTVTVMRGTRTVLGVGAVVVRSRAWRDSVLVSEAFDWYAQDRKGNVWWLGREARVLRDSLVADTAGSWEAGRDSACAGIVMPAIPEVGEEYRKAYRRGVVEDLAAVLNLDAKVMVLNDTFTACVATEEWSALGRGDREQRVYAPGLGLASRRTVTGEWMKLVRLTAE